MEPEDLSCSRPTLFPEREYLTDALMTSTSDGPRIIVPKARLVTNETPTPTKLLQAIEEEGLFKDDDFDIPSRGSSSVRSSKNANPFDEHFRKATQKQRQGIMTNFQNTIQKDDEVLNTPKIPISELPTPSIIDSPDVHDSKRTIPKTKTNLNVPTTEVLALSLVSDSAFGDPLCSGLRGQEKEDLDLPHDLSDKRFSDVSKARLRERNRVAAYRSRAKKRVQTQNMIEENKKLSAINKVLMEENKRLKDENKRLIDVLTSQGSIVQALQAHKPSSNKPENHLMIIPVGSDNHIRMSTDRSFIVEHKDAFKDISQHVLLNTKFNFKNS